jgi:hypothetical protein
MPSRLETVASVGTETGEVEVSDVVEGAGVLSFEGAGSVFGLAILLLIVVYSQSMTERSDLCSLDPVKRDTKVNGKLEIAFFFSLKFNESPL